MWEYLIALGLLSVILFGWRLMKRLDGFIAGMTGEPRIQRIRVNRHQGCPQSRGNGHGHHSAGDTVPGNRGI